MWEKIKKLDTRLLLLIALIVAVLLMLHQCGARKNAELDLAMANNNIHALSDTITQATNKLGNVQYEKSVLITSEKGLKDLNQDLANEVKAQSGKIGYLQKVVSTINTTHDNIITVFDTVFQKANSCDTAVPFLLTWNANKQYDVNNFRKLNGTTAFTIDKGILSNPFTTITEDILGFDLVTGLEKKDDHYEIFIRSNYPGFKPTKIDGAFIPQKDLFPTEKSKRWNFGIGLQAGLGAGFTTLTPTWFFGIGLGIQYTLFRF